MTGQLVGFNTHKATPHPKHEELLYRFHLSANPYILMVVSFKMHCN